MTPPQSPPIREHVGIAVDGGGIKGAIVAQGLIELERLLGVERLIESPQVKVIAGTSTGSVIAAGLAAGLSGAELLDLYRGLGARVFEKPGPLRPFGWTIPLLSRWDVPNGLVRFLERLPLSLGDLPLYALFPARYSFDPLRELVRETLAARPFMGSTDPTLEQVGEHLRAEYHGPTIIITAAEVSERYTHFLKTTPQERYKHMLLVDAVLASSSIPTYFPQIALPTGEKEARWLVDGGVGSFGNPALVVAWELCDPRNPDEGRRYDPENTTLFAFGTGHVSRDNYRRKYGTSTKWWALEWVPRVLDMFGACAIREQTRNVVYAYPQLDLRRFQVELSRPIGADEFDLLDTELRMKGEEMRNLVRDNRHALHPDPDVRYDPEGIWHSMLANYVPG